ncbi:MAG: exodeoxyribonuclease III [Gammaproteobacteria bacterium]|nr:exodeoxyribonuclease III [Gammaproteobacteria bacterium]
MTFKIATWNVNSLRVRLPQVLDWLASVQPDVLALQETKLTDPDFPAAEIQAAGYQVIFSGQKTYNGMAILSRVPASDVVMALPDLDDPQKRVLAATFGDIRVLNLYIPNGESVGSDKYQYKLGWLEKLDAFVQAELKMHTKVIILGDFNIAPEERDVHDPAEWEGKVLFSEPERAAFQSLIALGFQDCFRLQDQPEKSYSWWDYRMNAFKRNRGLRIDHILISSALVSSAVRCHIDKVPRGWERPSDHTPVVAEFAVS